MGYIEKKANKDATYKVGDIVRYGPDETELMQVSKVQPGSYGRQAKYEGRDCLGGIVVATYHNACSRPRQDDLAIWERNVAWRRI